MNILHISTGKTFRGGERQIKRLHEGLREKGINSLVLCRKDGKLRHEIQQGVTPLPWKGGISIGGLLGTFKICVSFKPHIIHCHDAHALTCGALISLFFSTALIYTRRVLFPISPSPFSQWKYRRCTAIIGISHAVVSQVKEGIPNCPRVTLIHSSVFVEHDRLNREKAREMLSISADRFVVATVGHFSDEKNAALLISAASKIQKTRPNIIFLLIGPYPDSLSSTVPQNCILTGMLHNASQYYSAFDIYVSTSNAEGLGTALADAVISDIPAVATDAGGTRDIFPSDFLLVPQDDPKTFELVLMRSIDNYDKAQSKAREIGKRARALFSLSAMIEKTLSLYDSCLD